MLHRYWHVKMGALDTSASLTAQWRGWGWGWGGGGYSNEFSIITITDQINIPKKTEKVRTWKTSGNGYLPSSVVIIYRFVLLGIRDASSSTNGNKECYLQYTPSFVLRSKQKLRGLRCVLVSPAPPLSRLTCSAATDWWRKPTVWV